MFLNACLAFQVRRFFKSFKKFSKPLRHLDTIAYDADLKEKPVNDLRKLAELIIERCEEAMKEHESQKENEKTPEVNGEGMYLYRFHFVT